MKIWFEVLSATPGSNSRKLRRHLSHYKSMILMKILLANYYQDFRLIIFPLCLKWLFITSHQLSEGFVAEGISYFCLAHNLIRPIGSTHNFTQSGWLILFSPDYLSGQHKLGKSAKHSLWLNNFVQCRRLTLLFNSSSSSMDTMREAV